jgi:Kef-type K+ transport system membrane component KefB
MHIDPLLPPLVGIVLSILLLGLALRRLGQPEIIRHLIAGALIGPQGFGW